MNLKKFLKQIFCCSEFEQIEKLKKTIKELRKVRKAAAEKLIELEQENFKLRLQLLKLIRKKKKKDADYWNNKWMRNKIYYSAPKPKPVQEYLKLRNSNEEVTFLRFAKQIIQEYNLTKDNVDAVPLAVMKWRQKYFQKNRYYKEDIKTFKKREYWSNAYDTLINPKRGWDCDDLGVVLYNIIKYIFIEFEIWDKVKYRLKCVCGNINRLGAFPSCAGAHFYLIWLADDEEWYVVETTYYVDRSINLYKKIPAKYRPEYGTIWFTFNEDYAWSQHSFTISKKDWKNKRCETKKV